MTYHATAVAEAERLAGKGLAVFPCRENKTPATPHGFRDATREADAVRALWRQHPGPLIGVASGAVSDLAVLDLDARHGAAAWWIANRDRLPSTRTHRTRSGGLHLLFRHREGLRCSTSRIAPGVDVRAESGCVIWWPAAGLPVLATTAPAAWPDWLADLALPPPAPVYEPVPSVRHVTRYAEAALRRAAEHVAGTGEGGRNAVLNAETFSLMRLVRAGALDACDVAQAMASAGIAAGLARREIETTLNSAMRAGGAA